MHNVITEIPWIATTHGKTTIHNALNSAHVTSLDTNQAGYFYGAQLRILTHVAAVALRHTTATPQEIIIDGFPEEALKKAEEDLDGGAHLAGGRYPFMQWPSTHEVTKWRNVHKLLPTVASDYAERFWSFNADETTVDLATATLWLATFALYSPPGNAAEKQEDGKKRKMETGSPGFRYNRNTTPTEVVYTGKNLAETVLAMTEKRFVHDSGLPAWADRTGRTAVNDGEFSPLWRATFTINAAKLRIDENEDGDGATVTECACAGVPTKWLPIEPKKMKEWIAERNTEDLFYLYLPGTEKNPKPRLQYFPVDQEPLSLAVKWATSGQAIYNRNFDRVLPVDGMNVTLIQHVVAGNATAPSIRSSTVNPTDPELWPVADSESQKVKLSTVLVGNHINECRHRLRAVMATDSDAFLAYENEVVRQFWANVETAYRESSTSSGDLDKQYIDQLKKDVNRVTINAFSQVCAPLGATHPDVFYSAQAKLRRFVYAIGKEKK